MPEKQPQQKKQPKNSLGHIRLNPEDEAKVRTAAGHNGMALAAYVREAAVRFAEADIESMPENKKASLANHLKHINDTTH